VTGILGVGEIKEPEMGCIFSRHERDDKCIVYNILVRNPQAKRSLGKPKRKREDNIKYIRCMDVI
jgi:hypothetical protein